MKLEVECTWNEKRNKAKQIIHFDFLPKSIFSMPKEKILCLQQLLEQAAERGPPVLGELQDLRKRYPKSLYADFIYYRALEFFELTDESAELFSEIQERYPQQVLTKCILANRLIKQGKWDEFPALFDHVEALKGAFPKRKAFFCEEALFFHHLWIYFYEKDGNGIQGEKHKRFFLLITQMLQSFHSAQNQEVCSNSQEIK